MNVDDIEAWIETGKRRIADAIAAAPSHLELHAGLEALMRHLVTPPPSAEPEIEPATDAQSPPEGDAQTADVLTEGLPVQGAPGEATDSGGDPSAPPPPPPNEPPADPAHDAT